MSEPKNLNYGISKDKSHFCEFSPEVIAERAKFPELTLSDAVGNCVEEQNKEFVEPVAEVEAEPVAEAAQ